MRNRNIPFPVSLLIAILGFLLAGARPGPRPAGEPAKLRENSKDGLKYVWVPAGVFMMGCSAGDGECSEEEKPSHRVVISKGFWMGQTEVTVGAYKRFAQGTRRPMPPEPSMGGDALYPGWASEAMPIVNMNWEDAHAYCSWTGGRLPTEAEWEYAARGGSDEARYGPADEVAWFGDNSGQKGLDSALILNKDPNVLITEEIANGNKVHPVGQKRPNGFGLFDMLGNAWEWVNDWYDGKYYQAGPQTDPRGPSAGEYRVIRGGSWGDPSWDIRASYRGASRPDFGWIIHGFRCVLQPPHP